MHFSHFNGIVHQVIVKNLEETYNVLLTFTTPIISYTRSHFSEHGVPVIPEAIEAKDLAIQLEKLFQLIEAVWSLVLIDGQTARLGVGIFYELFALVEKNALALHKILKIYAFQICLSRKHFFSTSVNLLHLQTWKTFP